MFPASHKVPIIRPITDIRAANNSVIDQLNSTHEPIILTKNGLAACVLMSVRALDEWHVHERVSIKLREVEIRSRYQSDTLSCAEVADRVIQTLVELGVEKDLAHSISLPQCEPEAREVRFHIQAFEDILDFAAYTTVGLDSPQRTVDMIRELFSSLSGAVKLPRVSRLFRDDCLDRAYRKLPLKGLWVYCTFEDGLLNIWRVLDPRQEELYRYVVEEL